MEEPNTILEDSKVNCMNERPLKLEACDEVYSSDCSLKFTPALHLVDVVNSSRTITSCPAGFWKEDTIPTSCPAGLQKEDTIRALAFPPNTMHHARQGFGKTVWTITSCLAGLRKEDTTWAPALPTDKPEDLVTLKRSSRNLSS